MAACGLLVCALLFSTARFAGFAAADFAAAAVAFFGTTGFPAALAFLNAAQRFFVAAMIRSRPSGLRRRFFFSALARAGGGAGAALAFRVAAQRCLCAAAMRLRAAGLTTRFGAALAGAEAGDEPPSRWRRSAMRIWIS
jgi:hypothetical protein